MCLHLLKHNLSDCEKQEVTEFGILDAQVCVSFGIIILSQLSGDISTRDLELGV